MERKKLMTRMIALTFAILMLSTALMAQTPFVTWDFDAQNLTPTLGTGTITHIGGTEAAYYQGYGGAGSAVNAAPFPEQGVGNETAGIQATVSTEGKSNIQVTWAQRNSGTSANRTRVQYTLDGTSWVNFDASDANATNMNTNTSIASGYDNGLYITDAATIWNTRTANFSTITGANNNPNFAVRFVSAFEFGTDNYVATLSTNTYSPNGTFRFDVVTFSYTDANQVIAPVFSPNGGSMTSPTEVSLSCLTPNALIYYTTNGEEPTENSTLYTAPFTVSQNTTAKAKAYKTGMAASDVTTVNFTFPLTSLAQLRASNADGTTIYTISSEVFVTYTQAWRNQIYVQDATAAILIDDYNNIIATNYNIGDGITGLSGKISVYAGMLQFVPVADPGTATSTGNQIPARTITVEMVANNFDAYEAQLVAIQNVHFTATTLDTLYFTSIYPITDGVNSCNFRSSFSEANYIGNLVPLNNFNLVCILSERVDGQFITARSLSDFAPVANIDQTVVRKSTIIGNYPNPFNPITTIAYNLANSGPVDITIYNVKGQKVKTVVSGNQNSGSHTITWNGTDENNRNVSSGVYYYKLSTNDSVQIRKAILMK